MDRAAGLDRTKLVDRGIVAKVAESGSSHRTGAEVDMSIHRPTKGVHRSAAEKLLAVLAEMEAPDFRFYEPAPPEPSHDPPTIVLGSGPTYHPVFQKLWELLYDSSLYLDPYAALPEDPKQDGIAFSVMGASFPPEAFRSATLDQVRRYLVLCTRGERFCDGHVAGEWDSGALLAALRRFRELSPPA